MNKRAQEGMSITTIIGLIIAIVVLVVVVLGFTMGWDYIFDKIRLLPNDLTSATETCKTYAGLESFAIAYCEYRELRIEGKKQFMNCNHVHAAAEKVLGAGNVDYEIKEICGVTPVQFCQQLKINEGTKYDGKKIVAGKSCGAGTDNWGVPK